MKRAFLILALGACSHSKSTDTPGSGGSGSAASEGGQVHAFKIGALDAVALKDGSVEPPNDGKTLGIGHPVEEISALLAKAGAPTDHLEISMQPLLVKDGTHVLLFDTGLGDADPSHVGRLPKSLGMASVAPSAITDIFISHSHGDHVGGLVVGGALAFPNATIHMSAPEWDFMQKNDKLKAIVAVIAPKVAAFEPGAKLLPEVTAVATQGHTPGHSSYDISSNGEHLFYFGDLVHSWVISIQRPGWTARFDADHDAAEAMRKQTLAKLAADNTRAYAFHFPFPGLGHVVGQGDELSWQRE
jgi:glyoxylase-like metal-dependent hydrolase (beta-lactamase superfamily II)